ncbi:MAG: hypothetical protein HQM08_10800 [Candidatus Riflebacteria bacterium]|nr:hypothetical protein [Candidatus Riflebacteria bacterium]
MKALELAFNQLLEEMEVVVGHNLKVIETKVSEAKELLPIFDKKLLHTHDLLTRLDEIKAEVPNLPNPMENPSEVREIKRDCKTARSKIEKRLEELESKFSSLEIQLKQFGELSEKFENNFQISNNLQEDEVSLVASVADSHKRTLVSEKIQSVSFNNQSTLARKPINFVEEVSLPETLAMNPVEQSVQPELPQNTKIFQMEPPPGAPFHDVISLLKQGITSPQIAKQLKMTLGEVELIVNLFSKANSGRAAK